MIIFIAQQFETPGRRELSFLDSNDNPYSEQPSLFEEMVQQEIELFENLDYEAYETQNHLYFFQSVCQTRNFFNSFESIISSV